MGTSRQYRGGWTCGVNIRNCQQRDIEDQANRKNQLKAAELFYMFRCCRRHTWVIWTSGIELPSETIEVELLRPLV